MAPKTSLTRSVLDRVHGAVLVFFLGTNLHLSPLIRFLTMMSCWTGSVDGAGGRAFELQGRRGGAAGLAAGGDRAGAEPEGRGRAEARGRDAGTGNLPARACHGLSQLNTPRREFLSSLKSQDSQGSKSKPKADTSRRLAAAHDAGAARGVPQVPVRWGRGGRGGREGAAHEGGGPGDHASLSLSPNAVC